MNHLPQWRAAQVAGQMVAQGLLAETEILPPIVAAAPDGQAIRARLLARFAAARDAMAAERRRASWLVRAALAPLVGQHAARAALLAAAAAADRRGALLGDERRRIAEALVRRALTYGPRR